MPLDMLSYALGQLLHGFMVIISISACRLGLRLVMLPRSGKVLMRKSVIMLVSLIAFFPLLASGQQSVHD
jgi:hypothetical protein